MRILVAGAGPAGLYFAYRVKRRQPGAQVRIVEQNQPDSTFGFGVVFSDRALEFLRADDPETFALITPAMQSWVDLTVVHRGERVTIDGIGFAAIGRLALLRLLRERLASAGVEPEYGRALASPQELHGYELVVAADGANSFVRGCGGDRFGTTVAHLGNKFAWYGTARRFETLTQTFVENEHGTFNAHHYRHAADMSTFVVECDAATWRRAGFAALDEAATRAYCERVFCDALAGHPLVPNRSLWRSFPTIRNARWSAGNTVLIGDALHTAHFSIGSGTRLALEDAIALDGALREHPGDLPRALGEFESQRRPVLEKLLAAADASGAWYEHFPEHMRLAPREFAWSYIQRSGRIDLARLRRIAPKFAHRFS